MFQIGKNIPKTTYRIEIFFLFHGFRVKIIYKIVSCY